MHLTIDAWIYHGSAFSLDIVCGRPNDYSFLLEPGEDLVDNFTLNQRLIFSGSLRLIVLFQRWHHALLEDPDFV